MTPADKRSLSRRLGFAPGGRNDPWREFWRKGIGIYIETMRGRNRAGLAVGMDIAWTPEEMLPMQGGGTVHGLKRQRAVQVFQEALNDYKSSDILQRPEER